MPVPELRARTASELVDATFQVVRGHYLPMLVLSAILAVPGLIVTLLAGPHMATLATSDAGTIAAVIGGFAVATLWYFVIGGGMVWYASQIYLGRPAEPADALRMAFAHWGRVIGASLLRYLYMVLGTIPIALLIGLGGVFMARGGASPLIAIAIGFATIVLMVAWFLFVFARYFITTPIVMLEGLAPLAALRRSAALMDGGKLRATALMVLALAIYVPLALLVSVPFGIQNLAAGAQIASTLLRVALLPLFAVLVALFYYDQRVRREAFDIELMSDALGTAGVDAA